MQRLAAWPTKHKACVRHVRVQVRQRRDRLDFISSCHFRRLTGSHPANGNVELLLLSPTISHNPMEAFNSLISQPVVTGVWERSPTTRNMSRAWPRFSLILTAPWHFLFQPARTNNGLGIHINIPSLAACGHCAIHMKDETSTSNVGRADFMRRIPKRLHALIRNISTRCHVEDKIPGGPVHSFYSMYSHGASVLMHYLSHGLV